MGVHVLQNWNGQRGKHTALRHRERHRILEWGRTASRYGAVCYARAAANLKAGTQVEKNDKEKKEDQTHPDLD